MSEQKRAHLLALIAACALSACVHAVAAPVSFAYLRVDGAALRTTHSVHVSVAAPGFRLAGPTHRTDTFGGHPYEISLGAFLGEHEAVLVHGERVADASGASDYSNLPQAAWPSERFRVRRSCVTLSPDDIEGEHDLEWLRANGFDPSGSLVLEQSVATSVDHNDEVVVSLIVKDVVCEDQASVDAALAALQARIIVRSSSRSPGSWPGQ